MHNCDSRQSWLNLLWPVDVMWLHRSGSTLAQVHYTDVIMSAMASQITSLTTVYSNVHSGADQRKHQTPRHWPLCGNSPVTGEFPAQKASNAKNVSIWWRHHVWLVAWRSKPSHEPMLTHHLWGSAALLRFHRECSSYQFVKWHS